MIALPLLRPLRLLRLLVLLAALQKAIGGAIRGRVAIYTASGAVLLIYAASLAILETEREQPGAKIITNFGDAVWWSITTVTTSRVRRPGAHDRQGQGDRDSAHDGRHQPGGCHHRDARVVDRAAGRAGRKRTRSSNGGAD